MDYTFQEYADMHLIYGQMNQNARAAAREYARRFPGRRHPSHKVVLALDNRLRTTGSLVPSRVDTGRPRTTRTPETEEAILEFFEMVPEASTREAASLLGLSQCQISRVLSADGQHPYHFTTVQALLPEDYPRRMQFCRWLLNRNAEDADFLSNILWTDESIFTRNGVGNIHNMHYWSINNPHVIFPSRHQHRFSLNVWAGILNNRILGPILLPNRINGQDFLHFLTVDITEELDNLPLNMLRNLWFQLDGAPPHFTRNVQQWLNINFPHRWIGRGGPVPWPPRSPDLTPLDFFFWGYIKNKVYQNPITNREQLEQGIVDAAAEVTQETLQTVRTNLIRRAQACLDAGGRHFEHLL